MGHPYKPMLGFTGSEVTASMANLFGLPVKRGFLVEEVLPGSSAEAAGLRGGSRMVALTVGDKPYMLGGDIIVAIDGKPFISAAQLARMLLGSRPGQELRLTVYRKGRTLEVELPLERCGWSSEPPGGCFSEISCSFRRCRHPAGLLVAASGFRDALFRAGNRNLRDLHGIFMLRVQILRSESFIGSISRPGTTYTQFVSRRSALATIAAPDAETAVTTHRSPNIASKEKAI